MFLYPGQFGIAIIGIATLILQWSLAVISLLWFYSVKCLVILMGIPCIECVITWMFYIMMIATCCSSCLQPWWYKVAVRASTGGALHRRLAHNHDLSTAVLPHHRKFRILENRFLNWLPVYIWQFEIVFYQGNLGIRRVEALVASDSVIIYDICRLQKNRGCVDRRRCSENRHRWLTPHVRAIGEWSLTHQMYRFNFVQRKNKVWSCIV